MIAPAKNRGNYSFYNLFEQQAQKSPNNIAIVSDTQVTYGELLFFIKNIETQIISNISPERIKFVSVIMEPSSDFIATILTLLKMGIPYIPIDSNYPDSYQKEIITKTGSSVTLTNSNKKFDNSITINKHYSSEAPSRKEWKNFDINNHNVAYIIYTSGTTGKNKAVPIKHDSLINLFKGSTEIFNINSSDNVPLLHSISFDFSIWEIFVALLHGACLKIVPDQVRNQPPVFAEYLLNEKISLLNTTPSYFYKLFPFLTTISPQDIFLKKIIFGGEKLYPKNVEPWFSKPLAWYIDTYNMYGITEGTIHSTYKKIDDNFIHSNESNIGLSLPGVDIAIVDQNDNTITNNDVGELCLSGVSITPGYLSNQSLSSTNFIFKNLDGTGKKHWFKTGDIVKKNKNLEIIYCHRKSGYIKLNGYRIDLEVIREHLLKSDDVTNAVVLVEDHDIHTKIIVSYIESRNLSCSNKITISLKEQLPEYMLPNQIYIVKEFPININGKLDITQLKSCAKTLIPLNQTNITETETLVKKVWVAILKKDMLYDNINFFDAGGTSLSLLTLCAKLSYSFNINIQLIDLIKNTTIKQQTDFIKKILL